MGNFKKILCVLLVAALFGGCTAAPSVITTIATTGAPTTAATTTAATTTGAITGTTTGAPTTHAPTTVAPTTVAPTTVAPTTVAPTTTATPTTSVQKDRYLLSFAGDCTLGENYDEEGARGTYTYVVGKNYSYPMANVKHIFEADDLTFVNLECALTASEPTEEEMVELSTHRFRFRGAVAGEHDGGIAAPRTTPTSLPAVASKWPAAPTTTPGTTVRPVFWTHGRLWTMPVWLTPASASPAWSPPKAV